MAHQLQRFFGSTSYNGRGSWPFKPHRRVSGISTGTMAIGSSAIGATALGALAFGAVAIGALAIRKLAVRQARVRRLEIDQLVVNHMLVRNSAGLRPVRIATGDEADLFEHRQAHKGDGQQRKREHHTASALRPGDDAAAGTPGTAEAICPDCNGTGLFNDTTCENCDGTGKVVQGLAGG
jgi:hypothetical protein